MAVISSPFGNPVYGSFGGVSLAEVAHPWIPQLAGTAAPAVSIQQILPLLESTLAGLAQMEQGWSGYGSAPLGAQSAAQPGAAAPVATQPAASAAASTASAGTPGNTGNSDTSSGGGSSQGNGLFGTNFMSGIFGPDSPVLNMVHGLLDPIPVVGDIANMICGVVSPGYHKQHEAEQATPSNDAAVSVAYSPPPSSNTDTSTSASASSSGY